MKGFAIAGAFVLILGLTSGEQHSFTIIDGLTCEVNDTNVVLTTYADIPDIDIFINGGLERAGGIRRGTWITYFNKNYQRSGYVNRDNCQTYTAGTDALQSLKRVGDLDDPDRETVTFYTEPSYVGESEMYYENQPNIDTKFNSLISVSHGPIRVYSQVLYGGTDSVCLDPYEGGYHTVSTTKYIWCDYMNPFCFEKKVRSFKFGCDN